MSQRLQRRAGWLLGAWMLIAPSVPAHEIVKDCPDCPRMVVIPGGTFTMGAIKHGNEPKRRKHEGPRSGVQVVSLVTKNVKDFGVKKLAAVGIAIQRPDPFFLALFQQQADEVSAAFLAFRQSLRSNPTVPRLLDKLAGDGQMQVAAAMLAAWQEGHVVL